MLEPSLARTLGVDQKVLEKAHETLQGLNFHRDHQSTNLYFVIPVFVATPSQHAASLVINQDRIENAVKLYEAWAKYLGASLEQVETLSQLANRLMKVAYSIEHLDEIQLTKGERDLYKGLYEDVEKKLATIDKTDNKRLKISDYAKQIYLQKIALYLGSVGITNLSVDKLLNSKDKRGRLETTAKLMNEVEKGNTGNFVINVRAILPKEEREALTLYQKMRIHFRLGEIKFSFLPVKVIEWKSLAELAKDADVQGVPVYRNLEGGGSFRGSALSADLSLGGAKAFKKIKTAKLGDAIILPIYPTTQITMKVPPFKASVTCHFKNWAEAKLRSDVKDGAVIYNDDLFEDLTTTEKAAFGKDKPCLIDVEGGTGAGVSLALQQNLFKIQERLIGKYFNRIKADEEMLKKLKEEHKATVKAHRVEEQRNRGGTLEVRDVSFFGLFRTRRISWTPRFYWHTTSQKLEALSEVDFDYEINYEANEMINLDLDVNVCVYYDKDTEAFKACKNAEQLEQAKPLAEVVAKAKQKGTTDGNGGGIFDRMDKLDF